METLVGLVLGGILGLLVMMFGMSHQWGWSKIVLVGTIVSLVGGLALIFVWPA